MSYDELRASLLQSLYGRRIVVDPYTIMEVATLVSLYVSSCERGYFEGAVKALSTVLGKLGVDGYERVAEDVIREVVLKGGGGCEENHRHRVTSV